MANLQIKQGFKVNYLTFDRQVKTVPYKPSRGIFKCDCGKETEAYIGNVTRGHTKSCGCHRVNVSKKHCTALNETHGMWKTDKLLVRVWNSMKSRCHNPNDKSFGRYGAIGITVCNRWQSDFKAFHEWCYNNGYEKGLQIDRRDGTKGYSPENCRFVTCKENNRNRKDNVFLIYEGIMKTLPEWAEDYGIKPGLLRQRITRDKMSLHDALNKR